MIFVKCFKNNAKHTLGTHKVLVFVIIIIASGGWSKVRNVGSAGCQFLLRTIGILIRPERNETLRQVPGYLLGQSVEETQKGKKRESPQLDGEAKLC